MKYLITLLSSMFILVLSVIPALAHSLESFENTLSGKEKYFQAINEDAPDFTLLNADSKNVSLADLKGKVIILYFIPPNCPDTCSPHANKIAELQEMINLSPMRDLVQFVAITTDPEIMQNYASDYGLDLKNWTFFTSEQEQFEKTRELVMHIIGLDGRWRANFYGLKFNATNFILYINALTRDGHGIDKH